MSPSSSRTRGWLFRLSATAVALSLLMVVGMLATPPTTRADTCTGMAAAIGANDNDNDPCSSAFIFANDAMALNTSSPFSLGLAGANAEANNANLNRPTYAWSYNTDTFAGLSVAGNNVQASDVTGNVFGSDGSAYATSNNLSSDLVLAGAANDVRVNDTTVNNTPGVFEKNVFSNATNINCFLCAALSGNRVNVSGVNGDIAEPYGVSQGTIYAQTLNQDAAFSAALAYNDINIQDSSAYSYILEGDPDGNGSYATARNAGGNIVNGDCLFCFSAAYNSLDISNVLADDGSFMEAARAAATNDYSSGASAIAINKATFDNVEVGTTGVGLGQVYAYAFNNWSPDSDAAAKNLVNVQGLDGGVDVDTISDGSLWSQAENYECYECTAKSFQKIDIEGQITAQQSILGGGASAYAYNEGSSQAVGFGDNTAVAANVIKIEGDVSAGNGLQTTDVQAAELTGNVVSKSVYSYAHNYEGGAGGYCYECVAVGDNFLKIEDTSAGSSIVDTDVYSFAENYNSYEVLAKSNNKVIIKDSTAGYSVISDPPYVYGSVYAHTSNRYCDECKAIGDNLVVIDDSSATGTILNGHAYAWAENNLDSNLVMSADVEEEGNFDTAVAYNTLIIKDNEGGLQPTAFALGDTVSANVYSCASNNVGGGACGMETRCGEVCPESAPSALEYQGTCDNCHAYADNFVKLTGNSIIDTGAQFPNNALNSTGGVYAHAENTAQGVEAWGACESCLATATNTVIASGNSVVDGTTAGIAVNENSVDSTAVAHNSLILNDGTGHSEASAYNYQAENSAAIAVNQTTATDGGNAESLVNASNYGSTDSAALGLGLTNATDGGTAANNVTATTGDTSSPSLAVAVGMSNADGAGNTAVSSSNADASNADNGSGVAYSVSLDENGNVALAVAVANNGSGVAVTYTNAAGNNTSTADAQAGGGGSQGGDFNAQIGTPTANTDVGTTQP